MKEETKRKRLISRILTHKAKLASIYTDYPPCYLKDLEGLETSTLHQVDRIHADELNIRNRKGRRMRPGRTRL